MTTYNLTAILHPSPHLNPFCVRSDSSSSRKRRSSEIEHEFENITSSNNSSLISNDKLDQIALKIINCNSKKNECSLLEACNSDRLTLLQKIKIAVLILNQIKHALEKLDGNGLSTWEAETFLPENIRIHFTLDNQSQIKFAYTPEYAFPQERDSLFDNDPRSQLKDLYIAINILNKMFPSHTFEDYNQIFYESFLENALDTEMESDITTSIREKLFDQLIHILEDQGQAIEEKEKLAKENEDTIIYRSSKPLHRRLQVDHHYSFMHFSEFLPPRSKLIIINNILQKIFYSPNGLSQEEILRYHPRNLTVFYSKARNVTIYTSSAPMITELPQRYRAKGSYSEDNKRFKADNLFFVRRLLENFFPDINHEPRLIRKKIPELIDDLTFPNSYSFPEIFKKIQQIYFDLVKEDKSRFLS